MKQVSNKIGKVLILIGIILIFGAVSMKFITENQKKSLISDYRAYQEQLRENENKASHIYPKEEIDMKSENDNKNSEEDSEKNQAKKQQNINSKNTIAIMKIPKIKLETAVCEGVGDEVLCYAVGHFPETALPGQKGNFAVTGHRNYIFGQYFNRLDELEAGDLVIVESETKEYTYEITDKFVVEPEELWVLDETENESITLITCTPIRIATHRLIVKGKLTAEKKY